MLVPLSFLFSRIASIISISPSPLISPGWSGVSSVGSVVSVVVVVVSAVVSVVVVVVCVVVSVVVSVVDSVVVTVVDTDVDSVVVSVVVSVVEVVVTVVVLVVVDSSGSTNSIVMLFILEMPLLVAMIFTGPSRSAVSSPSSTVAIVGLEETHVTVPTAPGYSSFTV